MELEKDTSEQLHLPDGRRTQLWRGGSSRGPVVFFMHGCPDCRLAAKTGDAAARRAGVQLIAVNRPGYGRSDPSNSSHGSVAHDTIAVADRLGIDRFSVLGMSLGGPYALACAALYPQRVTAAAVVAAPAVVSKMSPPFHRDDLTPDQQDFFGRLASSATAEAVALVRPDFEDYLSQLSLDDPDEVALVDRWLKGLHAQDAAILAGYSPADVASSVREALAQPDGYLQDAATAFREWDFRPEDVTCPTSLWYGELDANASVRNGQWLAQHLEGSRLHVRPQTAHLATLINQWDDILMTLASS